jgi:hypothetical protein
MKAPAQMPPLGEPKTRAPSPTLRRAHGARDAAPEYGGERVWDALAQRATGSVERQAAVDTGYGALIAEAAAPASCFGKLPLQAKLQVGAPGDALEVEADQMAERVMCMPDPAATSGVAASGVGDALQRKCAECREEEEGKAHRTAAGVLVGESVAPPIVHEVLRSAGQPLDAETRAFMEPRFGHDFGNVRVHTDRLASRSAEAVAARAYTVGPDVVFKQGEYAPDTLEGRRILAHELSHVVQQSALGTTAQRTLEVARTNYSLQRDEDDASPEEISTPTLVDEGPAYSQPTSTRSNLSDDYGAVQSELELVSFKETSAGQRPMRPGRSPRPVTTKSIIVDTSEQTLTAYVGTNVAFVFNCVSGDSDHRTHCVNKFPIYWKHKIHRSSKYNAQMNYAMFFNGDEAIHQGSVVGPLSWLKANIGLLGDYVGSHGCVRLTEEDARALFDWAPEGTPVTVTGDQCQPSSTRKP